MNTLACAVCSGASDAAVAPAVNASIGLLLFVLVVVGCSFFRFLLYLARHDGIAAPCTETGILDRTLGTSDEN